MKSGIIAIVAGLTMIMASIVWADVPGVINYQGRLTDPNGAPVADSSTNNFTFSIFESTNAVTPLWAERHANVPVMNGLFSVLLGSVTNPLSPTLFATNGGITRWLEVEVNGETLAPRKELVSVAYALQAGNAATLAGLPAGEFAASSLTNEIIALQSSTNFLLNQTIILQGATNVLQAQATDLQAATGALNAAVGNLNVATGALNMAVGDLQTATNALQLQVGDLQSATNALNAATNSLQAQLAVLATSAVTQAQDPMIISNGTVFLDYDTNDFVLRGQIGVKNADMVDGMHASNIIEAASNAVTPPIVALQGAVSVLNLATNALNTQVRDLQGATNALNTATNALQVQAADLQEATGALNTAVGNLNAATGALQIAVGDLQTATNALNIQVGALQSATNALNAATNSLQAQLGVLATAAVTKAQDPMIISNGTVIWDYDTNDFKLAGQAQVVDKWVNIDGDFMFGHLTMSNGTGIWGTNIIDSQAITDGTITNDDVATNADIDGTKIKYATTATTGTVRLATSTDTAAGLAVQASDTRLGNSRAPSGDAGGDLTGTYPNPTITNNAVTSAKIADGTIADADISPTANISASKIDEADPLWDSASNAIVTQIAARLASNVWASADSTTNYLERTGGTMSGALNMQGNVITNAIITNTTYYGDGRGLTNLNETDPQVGAIANGYVPRWEATNLVTGTIFDNGNVGIGITAPDYKLDVNGSVGIRNGNSLRALESGGNSGSANLQYVGSGAGAYAKLEAGDYYTWRPVVLAPSGGNVGIGTKSPEYKLDVNGMINLPANTWISGAGRTLLRD